MPLRTRLLLALTALALFPLILIGVIAYFASTDSLIRVERDNLATAVDSVNRAVADIQNNLSRTTLENSNWTDLHDQVAKDTPDPQWLANNFGLDNKGSVTKIHGLSLVGIWNSKAQRLVYSVGPIQLATTQLQKSIEGIAADEKTLTRLVSINQGLYVVSIMPIHTDEGQDPDGVLLLGHQLGDADVNQIKELTGYDVALYNGINLVATTQQATLTPAPDALNTALTGQQVFDLTDRGIALAYDPIKDADGNIVSVLVVWRPRTSVVAAQGSIAGTVALGSVISALIAIAVAFALRNSIARPLLAMADSADKMAAGDLSQRVIAPPVKDELGRLAAAFNQMAAKVGERVTESESEKDRLQAVDEFRLKLFEAIAQALNAPVDQIHNHSQSLDMQMYGTLNDAQRASVTGIRRAANAEKALLSDLLDFAYAQQNQLRIVRQKLTLNEIIGVTSKTVNERFADKHIRFTANLPEDLPAIFADPTRMEQILDQALSWAFAASVPNGQVRLSAITKGIEVQVSISDTSSGLTPEQKKQLFELFYQPNLDGKNGGNGLGLAFIKALLEQQNGTMRVEVQPSKGNTLIFTVPTTT